MKKRFAVLIVAFFLALASVASAQSTISVNQETVIRPDIGPKLSDLEPGEQGYKVFNPGAIVQVQRIPASESGLSITEQGNVMSSSGGTGSTDVWYDHFHCCPGDYHMMGSHLSESTLWEDDIWADGYIKVVGQGWRDQCSDHTSGTRAHCNTGYHYGCEDSYGETDHYWHKEGYQDNWATSSDSHDMLGC